MLQALGGIQPHPAARAFDRLLIRPRICQRLAFVNATYASVRGDVRSAWRWRGRLVDVFVTIPVNAVAEVTLPWRSDSFTIGSGDWAFEGTLPIGSKSLTRA